MPQWIKDTAVILATVAIMLGAMGAYRWALSVAEDEMRPGDERIISVETATNTYQDGWADGYAEAKAKYLQEAQDVLEAETYANEGVT